MQAPKKHLPRNDPWRDYASPQAPQTPRLVLEGAKPIGGPATRPLPQLPLEVGTDGFLRAQDDYSEPVGPGFWNEGP